MAISLAKHPVIIDVKVKDVKRATDFYQNKLGLKLLVREKTWASFKARGIELHLNNSWGATDGVEFSVGDIKSVVTALKARGAKTSPIKTHSWGKIAYFRDSEGNKLAIVQEK